MSAYADTSDSDGITDWREVIGSSPSSRAERSAPSGRRPLSLLHALLIALLLEGGIGCGAALWLNYHPPQHGGAKAKAPIITAHLVLKTSHATAVAAHAKGGLNPRIGQDGGHRQPVPKIGVSSSQAGGVMRTHASGHIVRASMQSAQTGERRAATAVLHRIGDCAQNGCVRANALHRYERRLHDLLQTRLNAARPADAPTRITLRFYASPQGGKPAQVTLLDAQASAAEAARGMLQAVQGTLLPPFPRNLGKRSLAFEVTLSR